MEAFLEICSECGEVKERYENHQCRLPAGFKPTKDGQSYCPKGHLGRWTTSCLLCNWQKHFSPANVQWVEMAGGVMAKCSEHYVFGTRMELAGGCPLCKYSSIVESLGAKIVPYQLYCHGIINYVRVAWPDGPDDFVLYGDCSFTQCDSPISRYIGKSISGEYSEYYQLISVLECCTKTALYARRVVDGEIIIGSILSGNLFISGTPIAPSMLNISGLSAYEILQQACVLFGWDYVRAKKNYAKFAGLRNSSGLLEADVFSDLSRCTSHHIPYYLDESSDSSENLELLE